MNNPDALEDMTPDNLWIVFFHRDPISLRPGDANPVAYGFELADEGIKGNAQIHKAGKGCVIATLSARSLEALEKDIGPQLNRPGPGGLGHYLVATSTGIKWVQAPSSNKAIENATRAGEQVFLCGGSTDVSSLAQQVSHILLTKDYRKVTADRRPDQPPLIHGMSWLSRKHDPDIASGLDEIGGW